MDIYINDVLANITLDTEKTLGQVLSGIEQWLSSTGTRMSQIKVNEKLVSGATLEAAFNQDIATIKSLKLSVCSYGELALEAYAVLKETCNLYESSAFEERESITKVWMESAAARFLLADIPDMYHLASQTFSGSGLLQGLLPQNLMSIIEERMRELIEPAGEIAASEEAVRTIAQRMEQLPLDMQTGKDRSAAETIQLFSGITEKLLRLFSLLTIMKDGSLTTLTIGERSAETFLDEFNAALSELAAAYENKDTVLVGDLAEYELAPRIIAFYTALRSIMQNSSS